jgi:hypothetical protein
VKISIWSDILDLCKLPVACKGRQILVESGLCVIQVVKPKDKVHKSPIFESVSWPNSGIPQLLPVEFFYTHSRSNRGTGQAWWCGAPTIGPRKLGNQMVPCWSSGRSKTECSSVSQEASAPRLGVPKGTWLFLQTWVTSFMISQYNHIEHFKELVH